MHLLNKSGETHFQNISLLVHLKEDVNVNCLKKRKEKKAKKFNPNPLSTPPPKKPQKANPPQLGLASKWKSIKIIEPRKMLKL